jgi:general secretion pathway protein A
VADSILAAFGFKKFPFDKEITSEVMWLDESRDTAIDHLLDAITQRQHALVCGEPGVGKTAVLRAVRDRLSPVHFRPVYIPTVTLGLRDFYRHICTALGVEAKATPASLFDAIQRNVHLLHQEHRGHPVLVLDEAHLMNDATLGHLHILANFDWDNQPLLSLVLVGLPELYDRLKLGIHRSLLTRIATRVDIGPVSPEHTVTYVRKRIKDAGCDAEIFTPDGLSTLHEITGGLLRSVDSLAQASLRVAARQDLRLVDRATVRRALQFTPIA